MSRALTREEIAEALDKVGAEWDTVYRHHQHDVTYLVVEIEVEEGMEDGLQGYQRTGPTT